MPFRSRGGRPNEAFMLPNTIQTTKFVLTMLSNIHND
jgi:hypothetical protein